MYLLKNLGIVNRTDTIYRVRLPEYREDTPESFRRPSRSETAKRGVQRPGFHKRKVELMCSLRSNRQML